MPVPIDENKLIEEAIFIGTVLVDKAEFTNSSDLYGQYEYMFTPLASHKGKIGSNEVILAEASTCGFEKFELGSIYQVIILKNMNDQLYIGGHQVWSEVSKKIRGEALRLAPLTPAEQECEKSGGVMRYVLAKAECHKDSGKQ